jgi:hypothetical protein
MAKDVLRHLVTPGGWLCNTSPVLCPFLHCTCADPVSKNNGTPLGTTLTMGVETQFSTKTISSAEILGTDVGI